jgi:hypothetical protein
MMIVAFFAVLRRSVRRAEMRWWVYAGKVSAAWRVLARVFYVGPKTFLLLMLLRGT